MKVLRTLAILAVSVTICSAVQAQELKTAHFLDNYLYGYRLNPSVTPTGTAGFFGFGVSNISVTAGSNFGLSDFLFPLNDGRLVTGLNTEIPASQFPGRLRKMNRVNADLSENILAFGFSGIAGGYSHFEINLISQNEAGVPRSLFEAFKNENTTGHYLVENLNFSTRNYLEAALGYSKRVGNLAIGASLKGLVGVARMNASVDMEINTAGNDLWARTSCTMRAAAAPLSIGTDNEGYYDFEHIAFNSRSIRPAGYGGAIDIGASYYFFDDKLIAGAALRNVGLMKWNTNLYGENFGDRVYVNLDETDSMGDEFQQMIKFKPVKGSESGNLELLPFNLNLSAKYKPVKLITLGAVASVYNYGGYVTKDIRFGAAFTPFRQLNIAGTYAFGDRGSEVGAAVSVRLLGINVYVGVDSFLVKVSPQYIPINATTTTVNAGVSIAIGKKKEPRKKAEPQPEELIPEITDETVEPAE